MKHSIEKMRACLPLLPAPGEEVVAECLDEIESLRQQLANRELEVQHVLGKVVLVEQQLAAAHAARVSAQASGIRLLDRLAAAKEECNTLRRIHAENITILERKTAQAVATCKLKDEELEKIRGHIGLYNLFSCVGSDSYDPECADLNVGKCREIAIEALTIQPDDDALKQWLGEPVAYADPLDIAKDGNWDTFIVKHASECNDTLRFKTPLYSPKGLK